MAVRRSLSPIIKTPTHRPDRNTLKNSTKYNLRAQSSPSHSLRPKTRASAIAPGTIPWRTSGVHRPPAFDSYLPPEKPKKPETRKFKPWRTSGAYRPPAFDSYLPPDEQKKPRIPNVKQKKPEIPKIKRWRSAGRYIDKPPSPLSPEIKYEKPIREPTWQPAGRPQYKTVPHFDPSSVRRSIQLLLKSMPEFENKNPSCPTAKSISVTNSQYKKDF